MQSKKQCQMLDGTAFLGLREPKSGLARDLGDCYKILKKQDETFFISCASNK